MSIEELNEAFKQGRRAGHEDVAKEILRYDPSFAWQIAKEFLETKMDEDSVSTQG